MDRGIFQGRSISPLLILCAIEVTAILIRSNDQIKGIKVGDIEKKKTFEDLVSEYNISIKDMRKYNFLMNGILIDWFL